MNAEEKIIRIIENILGDPSVSVTPESNLMDDLGLNSLDAVDAVVAIEEEFHIEIPDQLLRKMITVQDMIDIVRERAEG